jgi:tryptophanyl-tRNA synthetase
VPEPIIATTGARIMILQDPTNKISKSDPNKNSTILLEDSPALITTKIKKAVTDYMILIAYDEKGGFVGSRQASDRLKKQAANLKPRYIKRHSKTKQHNLCEPY